MNLLLFSYNNMHSYLYIILHPQTHSCTQCSHMVVIVLNYTLHYTHRDNDDVEDLPAKDKNCKETGSLW